MREAQGTKNRYGLHKSYKLCLKNNYKLQSTNNNKKQQPVKDAERKKHKENIKNIKFTVNKKGSKRQCKKNSL